MPTNTLYDPDIDDDAEDPDYMDEENVQNRLRKARINTGRKVDDSLERIRNGGGPTDSQPGNRGGDALNPGDLKERERTGGGIPAPGKATDDEFKKMAEKYDQTTPHPLGDKEGKTPEPPVKQGKLAKLSSARKKVKGFLSKHKKQAIFASAGAGGLAMIILFIMFLAGTLLIPNFLQNSLAYRFATSARSYRQANEQVLAKKMALDQMDDVKYGRVRQQFINISNRFSNAKKMVLLEKYRPKKIVENMHSTGAIDFVESEPKGVFRRAKITHIIVNGEKIPLTDKKWYKPFGNVKDSFRLAADVDRALLVSQRGTTGIIGTAIRTSVASQILQSIGVRGLYAWANKGKDYKGTTPREADVKLLQNEYERIKERPKTGSLLNDVNETAKEASDETDKIIREGGAEAAHLAETGEQPAKIAKILDSGLNFGILKNVVSIASTTYGLAFPACMIVDASMERSGGVIDARANSLMKDWVYHASAAHQQISGNAPGEAVGAMNRELNRDGGFARSNVQQIANGGSPDTTQSIMPPQGSAAGDFSILNVLLPQGAAEFANGAADTVCPTLTNVWFGLAEGVAELVLGFFTGGASTAASKLGTAGVARAFTVYLADFAKSLLTKKTLTRFVRQAGTTAGLALLARVITLQYAGSTTDGTARGTDAVNNADAGGVLLNQEINRKSLGGRPLTAVESVENNIESRQEIQRDQAAQGVFERYFALSNAQSLASRTVINVGTSMNMSLVGTFLNMLAKIFNPANIASFFANAFAPKVQAADISQKGAYQVVQMGFSAEEERIIESNVTYWDLLTNDVELMQEHADEFEAIQQKYNRCFTDTMGNLLSQKLMVLNKDGTIKDNEGTCSPNNLGRPISTRTVGSKVIPTFASKEAELVFRWRISMRGDAPLVGGNEVAYPGTRSTSASAGNDPVSGQGDAKALAGQLLQRADQNAISLTADSRRDLERTRDGVAIGTCGAVALHPALLQVLLKISDPSSPSYYKMHLFDFVTGHGECSTSQHDVGKAVDIDSINNGAVENWGPGTMPGNSNPYPSENPALARRFVEALTSVMPQGSRMGQIQCAAVAAATIPSYIQTFDDTCHHIHIDMRNVK
jgi:hypothetical protein